MKRVFLDAHLAVLAALALATIGAHAANTPDALDQPPSNMLPAPVQIAPSMPAVPPRAAEPSGNPLWGIPLSALSATRERPLFNPSRRAGATAAAAAARAREAAADPGRRDRR